MQLAKTVSIEMVRGLVNICLIYIEIRPFIYLILKELNIKESEEIPSCLANISILKI